MKFNWQTLAALAIVVAGYVALHALKAGEAAEKFWAVVAPVVTALFPRLVERSDS